MKSNLYSIRMHAEKKGKHHSGMERMVLDDQLESVAIESIERAVNHQRGQAEKIFITVDALSSEAIKRIELLPLSRYNVAITTEGRDVAKWLLNDCGVSSTAIDSAINSIATGAASVDAVGNGVDGAGENMRGAMLVDASTGQRLEPNHARGVRASRFDLTPTAETEFLRCLERIIPGNYHIREAMVLASKVISAPGVVAELCWSDDPDYRAGYVASKSGGYQRISMMKNKGDAYGGRAFFVESGANIAELIEYLERVPVLIENIGSEGELFNVPSREDEVVNEQS